VEILRRDPRTHFKWTGYYRDKELVQFFKERGLADRHTYLHWMDSETLIRETESSDVILSCFPLSLGTVENIAADRGVPIVTMFDEECNLYWRDIYWEALNGNDYLRGVCLDETNSSKIRIVRTADEYISLALDMIRNPELADTYVDTYRKAFDYTYHANPNDIEKIFRGFVARINNTVAVDGKIEVVEAQSDM